MIRWSLKTSNMKRLDREYTEAFDTPSVIAPELKGKNIVFQIKTGLSVDDAQICEAFNIVLAAVQAGARVDVLFSGSASFDLVGETSKLEKTGIPERLRKLIAYQSGLPLEDIPFNYKEYLTLIHDRGATIYVNAAFNVVIGASDQVMQANPGYAYVTPITYAGVAKIISQNDVNIVY